MADWTDVAGEVAKAGAPLLGGIIGGPIGTAVGQVGSMIASALGTDNKPGAILDAIKQNPDAAVKLRQIEADEAVNLRRIASEQAVSLAAEGTKRIQAVNETMRAEGSSEHWAQWSWRPFNGFAFGATLVLNYALPAIVNSFAPLAVPHWTPIQAQPIPEYVFLAWASILGVAAWHRGVMQRIAAGVSGKAGGIIGVAGSVTKAVSKRTTRDAQ